MDIEKIYDIFLKSSGISIDSRSVKKDNLFFGIKGDNFDGNKYANQAIDNGAFYSIVDDKNIIGDRIIYVDDSLRTLQSLANLHRRKINIPIIAITGTNGKTTTKELISKVLSTQYLIGYTFGNLNNHIGVPITLLSFNDKMKYGIVEMGANHKNEINELCKIAEPNFGIITNIGKAHLEGFGNEEILISTKKELYDYLSSSKGLVFLNNDNELLKDICEVKSIKYGTKGNIETKGNIIDLNPYIKFKFENENEEIQTNLIGRYNFENILASVCIGEYFGISRSNIKKALETYTPQNNRSQIVIRDNNTILLDAYNANPSSMKLALDNFNELNSKLDKVIIIGDMFELGVESEKEHLQILQYISNLNLKRIYIIGKEFYKFSKQFNFLFYKDIEEFISNLKDIQFRNNFILIKASRGIGLERIVDHI